MPDNRSLKYFDAKLRLLAHIGEMNPGDPLPNRNALASGLSVSRTTVERAVTELTKEGKLYSKKGSGTFIAPEGGAPKHTDEKQQPKYTRNGDIWALLISNILYDVYPYILRGVEDIASEKKKNLVVCNTDNSGIKQAEYLNSLLNQGVSGVVVVPAIREESASYEIFKKYSGLGIPLVSCVRPIYSHNFPGILFNSFQAGFKSTMHLIEQGCKKIAYLSQPMYPASIDRYQGYLTALNMKGIPRDGGIVIYEDSFNVTDTGYEITKQLFKNNRDVDGIFTFNDRVAVGVYKALAELGYAVGRDVKVASCDNTDFCEKLEVSLTSMGFPLYEIGRLAGEYVFRMSEERMPLNLPHLVMDTEVYARASTLTPFRQEEQK